MELKTVSIFMLRKFYFGASSFATEYGIQQENLGYIGTKYRWELDGLFVNIMFEPYYGARVLFEENGKWKRLRRYYEI